MNAITWQFDMGGMKILGDGNFVANKSERTGSYRCGIRGTTDMFRDDEDDNQHELGN